MRAVRPKLLVEVGRTARLACEVRGFPAPFTAWYRDGRGDLWMDYNCLEI